MFISRWYMQVNKCLIAHYVRFYKRKSNLNRGRILLLHHYFFTKFYLFLLLHVCEIITCIILRNHIADSTLTAPITGVTIRSSQRIILLLWWNKYVLHIQHHTLYSNTNLDCTCFFNFWRSACTNLKTHYKYKHAFWQSNVPVKNMYIHKWEEPS